MTEHRHGDLHHHGAADRRRFRPSYLLANSFEAAIAIAAFASGVLFIVEPAAVRDSAVAQVGGYLAILWGALYGYGGLFVLAGLTSPSPRLELVGLSLFGSASLIDAFALAIARGPAGARLVLVYLAFSAASCLRAFLVLRLARIGPHSRP